MIFSRVRLASTNYRLLETAKVIEHPDFDSLEKIYKTYCYYKKFKSVMPFFKEQYQQINSEIIGYYSKDILVAYSLILKYPSQKSVMAEQFAWDYKEPSLRLGINSLYHECEFYKTQGYEFMYLGEHSDYKSEVEGYELLGPT